MLIKTEKPAGRIRNRPIKDYTGKTFHRLTAVRLIERDPIWNAHKWLFKCDCGNQTVVSIKSVRRGNTKSCGCLHAEGLRRRNTTHGLSDRPEYKVWKDMRSRCCNPRNKEYPNYGGRGITTCRRWNSFACFYDDMGSSPPETTIDRRDVNGNYEPENCWWAPADAQANNKRTTVRFTIGGETKSLAQWSRQFGIGRAKVAYRLKIGMSPEDALTAGDLRR